jgi:type II secretory pathway pseudopilin PulG
MNRLLAMTIFAVTLALVAISWVTSGGLARERMYSAQSAEEAVRLMLSQVQARNFDAAYARLENRGEVDKAAFIRDFAGSNGSLLTLASLETFDVWGLHQTSQDATFRTKLHYSTAVGPLDTFRDLKVQHDGSNWKVIWPTTRLPKLAPQVIPVNYLRWDVINRGAQDDWGVQNVDNPQVRIVSMNALQRPDSVVLVGEIVNEDTIPAYVNVSATLLAADGSEVAQEGSFDKISHTLLPKQVSPYRIDFPEIRMDKVKSVRMDAKSMLVPASADPVIEVSQQHIETDALNKKVLRGQLLNQSGQIVDIPHVLAAYYDGNGKVIWVSDGYVDQELLPQIPVSFGLDVPDDVAKNVQSYHVVVNYYDHGTS